MLQEVYHGLRRGPVLRVALEDLVKQGKAVAVDRQSQDHLFAIRTRVARIAALGLGIGLGQPLEIPAQRIAQGRAAHPVRNGQLRLGRDEPVEDEHTHQLRYVLTETHVAKNAVQFQPLPERVPHMDRPRLAVLLRLHPFRQNPNRLTLFLRRYLWPLGAGGHNLGDERLSLLIGRLEEVALTDQGFLHPMYEFKPLVPRLGPQIAQRTDGTLPGSLGRVDRFHEQVILVDLVLVLASRGANVHEPLCTPNSFTNQEQFHKL